MTYQEILDLINANLASGTKIPAVKHREVETALLDFIQENQSKQFDIKPIYVNSTYLGNNFESNGLGKNLRVGWAICNGNNGTPNIGGRTIVGYGGSFTTLNAIGGSKDAVVVAHDHGLTQIKSYNAVFGTNGFYDRSNGAAGMGIKTDVAGEDGTDKNMQPYIVLVYIMKL